VVLSCSLVEEGSGMGGMGGGALFSRTPATLVLRDLAVTPDLSPDTLTPFNPPAVPDPNNIILEAKGWFIIRFSFVQQSYLMELPSPSLSLTPSLSCTLPLPLSAF
jgi:hypothetical protein